MLQGIRLIKQLLHIKDTKYYSNIGIPHIVPVNRVHAEDPLLVINPQEEKGRIP